MKILIDIQGMQGLGSNRGIGRYTYAFTKHFIKQTSEKHEIYLLINGLFKHTAKKVQDQFKTLLSQDRFIIFDAVEPADEFRTENIWNCRISEHMREKLIKDIAPDILIITSLFEGGLDNSITSIGTYTHDIPTAVIFYDLIPYLRQETYLNTPEMKQWYMRKLNSLKRADKLLCISSYAQEEAYLFLGKKSNEMVTISSATDDMFKTANSYTSALQKYNISKPFLMHTSAYESRKNFEGLIKAYALLPDTLRQHYQLVLVCKLSSKIRSHLIKVGRNAGLKTDDLVLTGFVPDSDLITLYTQATLFVFPSIHEGFGLPVLEAMSCGTATIGSATSSIPEVIGRSDALFDPLNPQSIADKITEALTNRDFLSSLEQHALKQAKKFSWKRTAQKALAFIEEQYPSLSKEKKQKDTWDLSDSTRLLKETVNNAFPRSIFSDEVWKSIWKAIANNEKTVISQITCGNLPRPLRWRIEGPFDSSYSLALLNRETALALDSLGVEVALHSTEGPGDFDPDPHFLAQHPKLAQLHERALKTDASDAYVCSRNLYPPRVADMRSPVNMLHHYAWEESGFPQEWVDNFNTHLDGITCLSRHVEKIMIDNGVSVPLATSGCGVDHWERIIPDTTYRINAKTFRFLHVSSCFPRKGADILLKAYGDAFTDSDNVTLMIKTFPNPHNEVHQWLEEAKQEHANYPDVVIIEEDLSETALKALYEQCHVLVAPSRAEGFGLPLAEAMLSGLEVITTGWGGQLDFCTKETAWLIEYDFVPAQTHFELFNSLWAEPSRQDLANTMKELYRLPEPQRTKKAKKGRELLLKHFNWKKTAENLLEFVKTLPERSILPSNPKIGWISSWNTQCGIASYSRHLLSSFPEETVILAPYIEHLLSSDTINVHRCWHMGDGHSYEELEQTVEALKLDTLVIQFNYSFYDFEHFPSFIEKLHQKGHTIVVMLHSTSDAEITPHKKLSMLASAFKKCDRLLVHTPDDMNRLKSLGLADNASLFPHGILDWEPKEKNHNDIFTLATYGFFLPHKGLLEIIDTISILKEKGMVLQLKMINAEYPVPQSTELINKAKEKIEACNLEHEITLLTEYLSDDTCLSELSKADLLVFPYQETGESSSAAVRYGIVSGTPVAVTPLNIFDDAAPAILKLSGTSPEAMAESLAQFIAELKESSEKIIQKGKTRREWAEAHRYSQLGNRLQNILTTLYRTKSSLNLL